MQFFRDLWVSLFIYWSIFLLFFIILLSLIIQCHAFKISASINVTIFYFVASCSLCFPHSLTKNDSTGRSRANLCDLHTHVTSSTFENKSVSHHKNIQSHFCWSFWSDRTKGKHLIGFVPQCNQENFNIWRTSHCASSSPSCFSTCLRNWIFCTWKIERNAINYLLQMSM